MITRVVLLGAHFGDHERHRAAVRYAHAGAPLKPRTNLSSPLLEQKPKQNGGKKTHKNQERISDQKKVVLIYPIFRLVVERRIRSQSLAKGERECNCCPQTLRANR